MNLLQSLGIPGPEPSFWNGNYKERTAMVALCYLDIKVKSISGADPVFPVGGGSNFNHWFNLSMRIVYASYRFVVLVPTSNVLVPETLWRAGGWGARNMNYIAVFCGHLFLNLVYFFFFIAWLMPYFYFRVFFQCWIITQKNSVASGDTMREQDRRLSFLIWKWWKKFISNSSANFTAERYK